MKHILTKLFIIAGTLIFIFVGIPAHATKPSAYETMKLKAEQEARAKARYRAAHPSKTHHGGVTIGTHKAGYANVVPNGKYANPSDLHHNVSHYR